MKLDELLGVAAAQWPHKRALIFPESELTFSELHANAKRKARSLIGAGVRAGDHVGILSLNLPEYVESIFATNMAGATAVPLNARYRGAELKRVIADSDIRLLFTTSQFDGRVDFSAHLTDCYPELSTALNPSQLRIGEAPLLKSVVMFETTQKLGFISSADFEQWGRNVTDETLAQHSAKAGIESICLMIYTSGTTSVPKGCRLSHRAFVRNAAAEQERFAIAEDDCLWDPLPFFHISSLLPMIASMWAGAAYATDTHFDVDRALEQIYRVEPTILFPAFPAIMGDLLSHEDFQADKMARVRLVNNVAPASRLLENMAQLPQAVHVSAYGLTEISGVACHGSANETDLERAHTSGRTLEGIEARIVCPDSQKELGHGEEGEIQLRGYALFTDYYKDLEKTRAVMTEDGWLRTGDIGALDAEGRLSFRGRLKDMLKVGGENVAALEIEGLLLTHPAVKMAQVVGAPHGRLGEVPAAFIELSDSAHCGEEEIIQFCRNNIASFKVPRIVRFVEEWPSSATKIQKFKLIELLARPQPFDASSEAADE